MYVCNTSKLIKKNKIGWFLYLKVFPSDLGCRPLFFELVGTPLTANFPRAYNLQGGAQRAFTPSRRIESEFSDFYEDTCCLIL